jgi:cysteine synthase A
MISAIKGYKFIAVMPENFGKEKRKIMKAFGAKSCFDTKRERVFRERLQVAEKLAKKYKKVWLPRQFENPDNVEAHYKTTDQEILRQIDRLDAFVAGIGTGGTLMGVGKGFKGKI